MAVALEEIIKSVEVWLGLIKRQKPPVNPKLDPVLFVPGIAGSVLHAVGEDGKEERVWVRILGADREFRTKMWSRFDPATGQTLSMDEKTRIVVPGERHGLYAIDVLDPDVIIGTEAVSYYHDMIEQMLMWGFEEGKTLFGFGYDFRQSNRLEETMNMFASKLESSFVASGGRKIRIISHSMGGLLVKCFMSLHPDIFKEYVDCWIAIAAPFQGAPGYITTSLLNGMSFVDGWEQNFFISKWSMHQLLIECPSIYELMPPLDFSWETAPTLQVWRQKNDSSGNLCSALDSHGPVSAISVMKEALSDNMVEYNGAKIPLPFNFDILEWANKTREVMSQAKVPDGVQFYNIYGVNCETPHNVCYGSQEAPISDLRQLLTAEPTYTNVDGDGTVPTESSKADGLEAMARVGIAADHRGIICDRHVFRILKHWLKAGEPDPFYNPLIDYVILPQIPEDKQETTTADEKEDWEILAIDFEEREKSCLGSGAEREKHVEARIHLYVPQGDGKRVVEIQAQGIASCV